MNRRIVLAGVWTALTLLACWWPRAYMPADESLSQPFLFPHFDKVVHATLFGGVACLWYLAGTHSKKRAALVFGIAIAVALLSELGQAVPFVNREPDVEDFAADAAGAAVGLAAAFALRPPQGSLA